MAEVMKLGRGGYERAGLCSAKEDESLVSPLLPGPKVPLEEVF